MNFFLQKRKHGIKCRYILCVVHYADSLSIWKHLRPTILKASAEKNSPKIYYMECILNICRHIKFHFSFEAKKFIPKTNYPDPVKTNLWNVSFYHMRQTYRHGSWDQFVDTVTFLPHSYKYKQAELGGDVPVTKSFML